MQNDEPSLSQRLARKLLLALSMGSIVFFFIVVVLNWTAGDGRHWHTGDLKDGDLIQHHSAGQIWRAGEADKLYQGYYLGQWINQNRGFPTTKSQIENFNYVYPPLIAWISKTFAFLPLRVWLQGWFLLSIACFAAACWLILEKILQPGGDRVVLWSFALGFPSFYYTLIPSQNVTSTLLLFVIAGWMLNRGWNWRAGLVISCAFYKPQLMPYLAFFLFIAGQPKAAFAIVLGTAGWLAVGVMVCGWEMHAQWLASLKTMTEGGQHVLQGLNQSWSGFFLSAFPDAPRENALIAANILSVFLLLLVANFARFSPKTMPWKPSTMLFLAMACYLFISAYVGHYELLLALPWGLVFLRYQYAKRSGKLLTSFLWLFSLCSIAGVIMKFSIGAIWGTVWLVLTFSQCLDWPAIRRFWKIERAL